MGVIKLLSVKEAAAILKVSCPKVRRMIADGELPAALVGREYRISEKVLEAVLLEWMESS